MIKDLFTRDDIKDMGDQEIIYWANILMQEKQAEAARKALLDHLEVVEVIDTGGKVVPFSG